MYTSIAGVYRNEHVELKECPEHVQDEAQVIVTFLNENEVDLRAHGIDSKQAAELRASLAPFASEWNSPEMDIYDNYEAAHASR